MPLKFRSAAKSDIGHVRRSNQDSFGLDEALGFFVVCDGMGGTLGGEIASALAVQTFLQTAKQEAESLNPAHAETSRASLWRAVHAANRAVRLRASLEARLRGMGTTLVAAQVQDDRLTLINVGDSRAYLVRDGVAHQLSLDHSYVAESVLRGLMTPEQARTSTMQSVITRAIGAEDDVQPDLFEEPLHAGDVLLLASDGLTRHVSDEEIGQMLSREGQSAVEGCRVLIEAAKNDGGSDNVTCLVVRFTDSAAEPAPGRTPLAF